MLRTYFQLERLGTTVGREISAGITTFLTMAYILAVQPQMLGKAAMDPSGVVFATALSSAIATLVMGFWARYPIALAPGMGLNAYFTFSVVPALIGAGLTPEMAWRRGLGIVFLSGSLFAALTLLRVREALIQAVPQHLKLAFAAGIGLFIALIGLKNGGVIVSHPQTLVTLGSFSSASVLLMVGGTLLQAVFFARAVPAGPLLGLTLCAMAAWILGLSPAPAGFVAVPEASTVLFKLDVVGALDPRFLDIIFAFFFVDMFDTLGTLIGVSHQAGLLDADGNLPRANRAMTADAAGTMLGALLGTTTITSYIESTAGIAAGGRSGLTAVVAAMLFASAAFLAPVFAAIPAVATAPILVLVGALMFRSLGSVDWSEPDQALSAFLASTSMAFSFSIATGIAFGMISYVVLRTARGKARDIPVGTWIVALLLVCRFVFLG